MTAFIGYRKNDKLKGFLTSESGTYPYLGKDILKKFNENNNIEIKNFFVNRLNFRNLPHQFINYKGRSEIWKDWDSGIKTEVPLSKKSLDKVDHAYIFNLDEDTVELYRGGFLYPQGSTKEMRKVMEAFGGIKKGVYTHKVGVITRKNIDRAEEMCANWWDKYFVRSMEYSGTYIEEAILSYV